MKIIIKLHEIKPRVIGCTIDAKPEADDAQPKKKEGQE